MADFRPVFLPNFCHGFKSRFTEVFEIVIPDSSDSEIVIISEFTLIFGTVCGNGGITRMLRSGFAIFIKKVGEADFN